MHVHIKRITYVKYNHAHVKQCYISILDDTTVTQLGYILYLVYSMSEVENVTSYYLTPSLNSEILHSLSRYKHEGFSISVAQVNARQKDIIFFIVSFSFAGI